MAKKPGQNTLTGVHHIMSVNQVSSTPAASLLSTKAKLKQYRTNESPIPNQVVQQHHQQQLVDCIQHQLACVVVMASVKSV